MDLVLGWTGLWDEDMGSQSSSDSSSEAQPELHKPSQDNETFMGDTFSEQHCLVPSMRMRSPADSPSERTMEKAISPEDGTVSMDKASEKKRTQFMAQVFSGNGESLGLKPSMLKVNSTKAVPIDSDFCSGEVLFLHREEEESEEGPSPYADHFRIVKRQFEVRVQCVLKKAPKELFITGEVRKDLGMSSVAITAVRPLIAVGNAIAAARGSSVNYNINTECICEESTDRRYARPYWAVPIAIANFVQKTPAGGVPPLITEPFQDMPWPDKRAAVENLVSGDTLTVAFWDMYLNFEKREICNMPFGLNVPLHSVIGDQDLQVSIYDWVGQGNGISSLHMQDEKDYLVTVVPCQVADDRDAEDDHSALAPPRDEISPRYAKDGASFGCWHGAFRVMLNACSPYGDVFIKKARALRC